MLAKRTASTLFATIFAATLLGTAAQSASAAESPTAASTNIAMRKNGGVYVVPVSMNGVVSMDFIVDSGATDVNIPAAAYKKMLKAGTIKESDALGFQSYTMADGTRERVPLVRIRELKVGNMVMKDVVASIAGEDAVALLGLSFLERFASWSVDNSAHQLVLAGAPLPSSRPAADSAAPTAENTPATQVAAAAGE